MSSSPVASSSATTSASVGVSVAVCTRNRAALLQGALASLAGQLAPCAWEVLVVDNDSEDETSDVARAAAAALPAPLRLIREPQRGLAHARNRALAEARGPIVLFIDDDATCHAGWLAAHARGFDDPRVAGTGGRILPVLPEDAPAWFRADALSRVGGPASRYDFGDEPLEVGGATRRQAPFGANMGLRREAGLAAGGFRVDLGWGRLMVPGEDTDMMNRLCASGGRLTYLPDARVDHLIARERCNPEYFQRWYRGLGHASVLLDPPGSRIDRMRRMASAGKQIVKWWLRSATAGESAEHPAYGRMLRKRAAALGRLEQLMR